VLLLVTWLILLRLSNFLLSAQEHARVDFESARNTQPFAYLEVEVRFLLLFIPVCLGSSPSAWAGQPALPLAHKMHASKGAGYMMRRWFMAALHAG
jgi:hypothetical protein